MDHHPQPVIPQPSSMAIVGVFFCFCLSLALFLLFLLGMPPIDEEKKAELTLPRSVEDAKIWKDVLGEYVESSYWHTAFIVFFLYVFLQTFSIPGSIFLNVVSGAVFGLGVGVCIAHGAACTGASLAYLISSFVGGGIATQFFPNMLISFNEKLHDHRKNLFNYLLFLRLTPFLPNWFINLSSPILLVPYKTFISATFIGIFPAVFITVQAGATVKEMGPTGMNFKSMFFLIFLGFLSLVPTLKPVQAFLDKHLGGGETKVE